MPPSQVWKLPMRNPSIPKLAEKYPIQRRLEATYEESKRAIGYLGEDRDGLVWKLPMRNPSKLQNYLRHIMHGLV